MASRTLRRSLGVGTLLGKHKRHLSPRGRRGRVWTGRALRSQKSADRPRPARQSDPAQDRLRRIDPSLVDRPHAGDRDHDGLGGVGLDSVGDDDTESIGSIVMRRAHPARIPLHQHQIDLVSALRTRECRLLDALLRRSLRDAPRDLVGQPDDRVRPAVVSARARRPRDRRVLPACSAARATVPPVRPRRSALAEDLGLRCRELRIAEEALLLQGGELRQAIDRITA